MRGMKREPTVVNILKILKIEIKFKFLASILFYYYKYDPDVKK